MTLLFYCLALPMLQPPLFLSYTITPDACSLVRSKANLATVGVIIHQIVISLAIKLGLVLIAILLKVCGLVTADSFKLFGNIIGRMEVSFSSFSLPLRILSFHRVAD